MISEQTFKVKGSAIVQKSAGATNILNSCIIGGFVIQADIIDGPINF